MNFKIRTLVSSLLLLTTSSFTSAEELIYDYYGITETEVPNLPIFEQKPLNDGFERVNIYLFNSQTNSVRQVSGQIPITGSKQDSYIIDPATKKLIIKQRGGDNNGIRHVLNPVTNTWTKECETDNSYEWWRVCDIKIPDGGFTIDNEAKTSLKIGDNNNPTVISERGISGLITRDKTTGITSIGENSFKFQETSHEMKLWGTDSSGRIAPINITNGSKLLINGRDVEQSINNVGAMSAALTGLPTIPTHTTLSCGLGTGTHGGDFAFSGGCASKINEKLSINYAASMSMPGQDYAGDFGDKFSARAGFIWKLGKSIKSNQISFKDKKIIDKKISDLEKNNKYLKAKIEESKVKNNEIILQNKMLLARLEKLEKIALVEIKSKDLARK